MNQVYMGKGCLNLRRRILRRLWVRELNPSVPGKARQGFIKIGIHGNLRYRPEGTPTARRNRGRQAGTMTSYPAAADARRCWKHSRQ